MAKKDLPDKLPPQNIDAEKYLLGCLMLDRNAIVKVVDFIWPTDFYRKNIKKFMMFAKNFLKKEKPLIY